jgi:hypothetical protein
MGWLKLGSRSSNLGAPAAPMINDESKYRTQHIETLPRIPESLNVSKHYPVVSLDTPDERLPFIPADDVKESNCPGNGSLRRLHSLFHVSNLIRGSDRDR